MYQSFGDSMLTSGMRAELNEKARQLEHRHALRELQSERQAARWSGLSATLARVLTEARARLAGNPAATTPDCCPA